MTHLASLAGLASLPVWVVVAIAVVGIAEVVLDVVALVDLYRRPIDRVALGNKWAWVAIIVLVNLLGAILYFVVGRRPAPAGETTTSAVTAERRGSIADELYGARGSSDQGSSDPQ